MSENNCKIWWYAVSPPISVLREIAQTVGGTPLVWTSCLDQDTISRLYVKDEGQNPVDSYKD